MSGDKLSRPSTGLRYKDKVVIVTGGSRGIGKGTAEVFVQQGAKVVFCSNEEEEGKATEAELNAQGPGQALFVYCELTNQEHVKRLIEVTMTAHGRIDCLVNNAGAHPSHLPIDDVTAEDMRKLMEVNVIAYLLTCKYALPFLRKTTGNIINIGSLVTHIGEGNSVLYAASKGAVEAMSKSLALDEAKYNVRVNVVVPGNIWTKLWEDTAQTVPDPEAFTQEGKECQVMGRFGTPQEIGKACLYLAADATFSTGTTTIVSGGAELGFSKKSVISE